MQPANLQPATVFEIWQDLASKQREEALRQEIAQRVERRFQEQLVICRELAGKSDEEMGRLWDEMMPRFERLAALPRDEQWREGHTIAGERDGFIRTLWSPVSRSLAGFAGRLSPAQWAALRADQPLVFSSRPTRGELPLPPDVLRVFQSAGPSLSPPGRAAFPMAPEFEEKQRQGERAMQARWQQAEGYLVTFRFVPESPGLLAFLATAILLRGTRPAGGLSGNPGFHILSDAGHLSTAFGDEPERRARLEQDPLLSAKKPFTLDPRPWADPLSPGSARSVRLLPELFADLARAYGVNFIADSYWPDVLIPNPPLTGPAPLFEVLDRLCGNRSTWDHRGTLIRCRSRNWPQQRPSEIPLRLVRRWLAICGERGALPLEEYAALSTALSDVQIDMLPNLCRVDLFGDRFPQPLRDLADVAEARSLLRLYGRLSAAQQQALRAGKPLEIAQIPAPLRPLILATLRRIPLRRAYPLLDLEQWAAGHLTFAGEPDVRIRERRGSTVSSRLESAPAPQGVAPPAAVKRFPVTRLKLQIEYGAGEPAEVPLIVAADLTPHPLHGITCG